jgi:hypothetical protein
MIVVTGFVLGALIGALRAVRRKGSGFDIAQYAAAHAILFAILGLFLTIAVEKLV